jgi:hypothetical protein
MSDAMTAAEVRPLRASDDGVFMASVNLGTDALHGTVSGVLEVAKTVRGETFRLTNSAIEWVESVQGALFRVVRVAVNRADEVTRGGLDGVESVSSAFTHLVRGSGEAAGEVIARTAASIVGKKDAAQKAA